MTTIAAIFRAMRSVHIIELQVIKTAKRPSRERRADAGIDHANLRILPLRYTNRNGERRSRTRRAPSIFVHRQFDGRINASNEWMGGRSVLNTLRGDRHWGQHRGW